MAEMNRLAILGAGGFIGNRAVEYFALEDRGFELVAVVRRASSLALAGRFNIPGRVADTADVAALAPAFAGCSSLLFAIAADPATIVSTIEPVYRAAERAGIRKMVFLSSAMVHGQAPLPGTDERSALSLRQPFAYNRAKVRAEQKLQQLCARGATEVVILRPAIVYGPRSQWTGGLADQLLAGTAFLADGGRGICNAIYVDNLVHAIELALSAEGVNGEAFLINDAEISTWRDLVEPVARALGIDVDQIPQPAAEAILKESHSVSNRLFRPAARAMVAMLPRRLAEAQRAARRALSPAPPPDQQMLDNAREIALLQSCQVRLPSTKAEKLLGYHPPVSFAEGCRRSIDWLRFADYPVRP
jgi:nucleoside-diphosphate-sugar epimerase